MLITGGIATASRPCAASATSRCCTDAPMALRRNFRQRLARTSPTDGQRDRSWRAIEAGPDALPRRRRRAADGRLHRLAPARASALRSPRLRAALAPPADRSLGSVNGCRGASPRGVLAGRNRARSRVGVIALHATLVTQTVDVGPWRPACSPARRRPTTPARVAIDRRIASRSRAPRRCTSSPSRTTPARRCARAALQLPGASGIPPPARWRRDGLRRRLLSVRPPGAALQPQGYRRGSTPPDTLRS